VALNAAVVLRSLDPGGGGPVVSVPRLWRDVAESGANVTLLLDDTEENRDRASRLAPLRAAFLRPVGFKKADRWQGVVAALAASLGSSNAPDTEHRLVSFHGLWELNDALVARECGRLGVPYVVHPHGALEHWALRHHGGRKWIAAQLWAARFARDARMFRATSQAESDAVRAWGYRGPIALVPNAVDIPAPPPAGEVEQLRTRLGLGTTERFVLFISRLHPIKGLDLLLDAWAGAGEVSSGWRLVIAGPVSKECPTYFEELVRGRKVTEALVLPGALWGRDRDVAMAAADVVLLPSRSENFGMVVAESLAAGTPVITTEAAPWGRLVEKKAGWCVPATAEGLGAALREAVSRPRGGLREMGARGRNWMMEEFSWCVAGRAFRDALDFMVGVADRPACVALDCETAE